MHTNNLVEGYLNYLSESEKWFNWETFKERRAQKRTPSGREKILWQEIINLIKAIRKASPEKLKALVKSPVFYQGIPLIIVMGLGLYEFERLVHGRCHYLCWKKYPALGKIPSVERLICIDECVKREYIKKLFVLRKKLVKCEKSRDVEKCKEKVKKQIEKVVEKIKKLDERIKRYKETLEKYRASK